MTTSTWRLVMDKETGWFKDSYGKTQPQFVHGSELEKYEFISNSFTFWTTLKLIRIDGYGDLKWKDLLTGEEYRMNQIFFNDWLKKSHLTLNQSCLTACCWFGKHDQKFYLKFKETV